ncbi:MAG: carbonic anhydrase [Acidobacteriota bacterium]
MKTLLDGYERFRANSWPERRKAYELLARDGQAPKTLIVACIDSRVDPAVIFDTAPGETLTVRNVANLVPPYAPDTAFHGTSAALEFGVKVLEIQHLVVLGHGMCGGVKALLEGAPNFADEFVGPWMSLAESARLHAMQNASAEDRQESCEYEVVRVSLTNLMTFPWVEQRVSKGTLQLHGAWFNVKTGILKTLQPDGTFVARGPAPTLGT